MNLGDFRKAYNYMKKNGLKDTLYASAERLSQDAKKYEYRDITEAEAKKLGLRVIPLPRAENEIREDAGTNVLLLRSADEYLDNLLNPNKQNKPSSDADIIPLP